MNRTLIALFASLTLGACTASTTGGTQPNGDPVGDGKGDLPGEDPVDDPGNDPVDDPGDDPADDPVDDPVDDPSDPGDDPVVGAESEPNDSADAANAVAGTPASLTAALTAGDKDYYSVALEAGDAIEVETVVAAAPEGGTSVDTVVEVYAPGAAEALVTNDDGGENRGSLARFSASAAGQWVILVRGFNDTTAGDYTLEIRAGIPEVQPGGAESEPNDSSGQATAMPALPGALTATLEADGHDWFSFQAAGAGTYVLETGAAGGAAGTDTVIEAFGTDGTTSLGSDDDGAEAPLFSRLSLEVPAAGRYYVQVRGYRAETTGEYVIRVSSPGAGAE